MKYTNKKLQTNKQYSSYGVRCDNPALGSDETAAKAHINKVTVFVKLYWLIGLTWCGMKWTRVCYAIHEVECTLIIFMYILERGGELFCSEEMCHSTYIFILKDLIINTARLYKLFINDIWIWHLTIKKKIFSKPQNIYIQFWKKWNRKTMCYFQRFTVIKYEKSLRGEIK